MALTKARVALEILGLLIFFLLVLWLRGAVLHPHTFWRKFAFVATYIAVRAIMLARKIRTAASKSERPRMTSLT
jgi:hypothetical protein